MNLWCFWLIIILLLTIVEVSTVNLVSIWFILSAFFALIISFFTDNLTIQIGVFVLLGIVFLILTKTVVKNLKNVKEEKLNLERIIGSEAIVTKEIKKNEIGEVKVDGKYWSAVSSKKITVDSEVIIKAIDGVKLIVEKKEKEKKTNQTKKSKKNKE